MADIEIIKKPNVKEVFTPEQEEELLKCHLDPIYFIEKYLKIQHPLKGRVPFKMYPFQKDLVTAFHEQNKVIALTSRQMGKCVEEETEIKLRSPNGEKITMKIGDFYEAMKFRKNFE